ncbi:MAG: hypothetical protein H7343_10110 [Undibacterium sp.]|nr:hypothetical protein [Opitutaceae bacterium]
MDDLRPASLSKPARPLFLFGHYAISAGLAFIAAPDASLALSRLPSIPVGWTRFVGLLALVIGTYDIVCARAETRAFIRASVFTRLGFAVGTALLVAGGQMPPSLLVLGAVDAAGAIWTAVEIKRDRLSA